AGWLDDHAAARVADPHPLFGAELGAVGPRRPGGATRAAVVPTELAAQVAQSYRKVRHLLVHHLVDRVQRETDHEHGAEQRRPANDLFAPGVPEYAHGPSLQRIGSILAEIGRASCRERA